MYLLAGTGRDSLGLTAAQRGRIMKLMKETVVPECNGGRTVQTKGVVEASETVIRVGLALRQTIRKWTGVS